MIVKHRRYPRYPCSWPVLLWLTDERFLFGRAVDAGLHGMRVVWSALAPTDTVSLGGTYRAEVRPEPHVGLPCLAVVRHQRGDGIGVETREALPVDQFLEHQASMTRGQDRGVG